ncbi:hypothetical protein PITC_000870 [Penicillium italicum]|uniref:Uncharacterized protein n=1 Tax=Penicillium italicum TaxID=40296 RepID=A0A0A2KJ09_PENIT|nr:hypothetical protein PITC_000870 [Penicillium italicum]
MAHDRGSGSSLISDLPDDHIVHIFSHPKSLKVEADKIIEWFEQNDDGNQWIVVLGLRPSTIEMLSNDRRTSLGGISYRFQWEGSCGLIKVVPSGSHQLATGRFVDVVKSKLLAMGITYGESMWLGSTTYKFAIGKGKEGDQTFVPPSRCSTGVTNAGYPTLVIETGVSVSLPRLRQDAKKWFADTNGEVRIVILIAVSQKKLLIEKWELANLASPRSLTRSTIHQLTSQTPNSPAVMQPAPLQQPYCAHEVEIKPSQVVGRPNEVTGAPMVLPFFAVYDRFPGAGESDIVLNRRDFEQMTNLLL